jgi:hypothetical protein
MASVIAMVGDRIEMAEHAWMMIHDPFDANEETAEGSKPALQKIAGHIADIYAQRTGLSRRQIETMMRSETWMDAKDAVRLGFADGIYKGMRVAACTCDLTRLKNMPADAAAVVTPLGEQSKSVEPAAATVREPPLGDQIIDELNWLIANPRKD